MTDLTGRKHRRKLEAEFEHICATQARLLALVEHLVTEVQWLRNRDERTDGRMERVEFAVEALIDVARAINPRLPSYPQTQLDIPSIQDIRRRSGGHMP